MCFLLLKYRKLVHVEDIASPAVWNLIWKAKAPQRVRVFLWILWKNRLLTNCERVRRHMTIDGDGSQCISVLEMEIHAIRDCAFSRAVWLAMVSRRVYDYFFLFVVQ